MTHDGFSEKIAEGKAQAGSRRMSGDKQSKGLRCGETKWEGASACLLLATLTA